VDATLVDFDDTYALTEACKWSINNEQYATSLVRFAKARTGDFNRTKAINEIVTLLQNVYEQT
jgi:hypothetical protein